MLLFKLLCSERGNQRLDKKDVERCLMRTKSTGTESGSSKRISYKTIHPSVRVHKSFYSAFKLEQNRKKILVSHCVEVFQYIIWKARLNTHTNSETFSVTSFFVKKKNNVIPKIN